MNRVLIIEDDRADTQKAGKMLQKFDLEITSVDSIGNARFYLEGVVEGTRPAPELIVLDLGFPDDSGFAILRYWKSASQLSKIPVIVWTQMGRLEREVAGLFEIKAVIEKSQGIAALESAVRSALNGASRPPVP